MQLTWSLGLTIIFILIFSLLLLQFIIWQHPPYRERLMDFVRKAQSRILGRSQSGQPAEVPFGSGIRPAIEADVWRYRYHHGTNIGSVFCQERWLTPSMFHDSAQGSSELTAVESWIKVEGIDKATQRFEKHWREYVSDEDLDWLRETAKCTSIRLPIGYFTLGPAYCEHTAFKKVSKVYEHAWDAVKQLVERCQRRGIGVLIDLHGLPGGANPQDHSGSDSGKAQLWGSSSNLKLATKCVLRVAQEALDMEGAIGIQIVNEAVWDAEGMYEWYDKVLSEVSRVNPSIPIYISDGWDFSRALSWSQGKNRVQGGTSNPIVVDTHLYWAFTETDKQKSPRHITDEIPSKLSELDGKDGDVLEHGAAQAIVGEYSCVLTEDSWAKGQGVPKDDLVRAFGNAQSLRYQSRAGGSFFWTYRMDWSGGEWSFRHMTENGAILPSRSLTLTASEVQALISTAQEARDHRRGNTFGAHCQYWDSTFPGHYEHHRFEEGHIAGYEDAQVFFSMRSRSGLDGADKIGMLDLWCLKRLRDSGQSGRFAWEWEHGFRQGVRDFYEVVGV